MRSFVSNSKEFLMKLPAANVKENCTNESLNMDSNAITEKLLGMYWNTKDDTLRFMMNKSKVDTKLFDTTRNTTKVEIH